MRGLLDFLTLMDATALRAVLVSVSLFVLAGILLVAGRAGGFVDIDAFQAMLAELRTSPFGLAIVIGVFCVAAFFGAPQFALIAAVVAAFGPWTGFGYAWIATMCSGAVTFWTGRLAGERAFRLYAGASANRLSAFIGRNAFAASALVRNVPTAPFIVVNMAFGVSQARFIEYWSGMAVGVVPKIAVVAFAGQSLYGVVSGSPLTAILAAMAAAALWIAGMLYARARVRRERQNIALLRHSELDQSETRVT